MRYGTRRVIVCLMCCGAGLAVLPVAALGKGSAPKGQDKRVAVRSVHRLRRRSHPRTHRIYGRRSRSVHKARSVSKASAAAAGLVSAGGSGALSGSPLVVPGAEPLMGEQSVLVEKARLANPEAVTIREESRTKFEGLNHEQAARADGEAFPAVVNESAGGPPELPAGQSIVGYTADNVAQVDLGEGGHGVIEATAPMAVETSPGTRVPIDLGLTEAGAGFEPKTPAVGVSIPKRLGESVRLGEGGVSLTPLDSQGVSLGGSEGAVDGASVFYANTQTDADTLVKPTAGGFEIDTLLRSIESPEQLSFRVGLPAGASLVSAKNGLGYVQVVDEGAVLATVLAPRAQDAEGTSVPVSMSVEGDVLTLTVDHLAGSYRYPIVVDPEVKDKELLLPGNWAFGTDNPEAFVGYENISLEGWPVIGVKAKGGGKYEAGQYGVVQYPTQHESRVYEFFAHSEQFNNQITEETDTTLSIANGKGEIENTGGKAVILPFGGTSETTLCVESGCAAGSVAAHHENFAQLEEHALVNGDGGFAGQLTTESTSTFVAVAQEKGPSVSVDTTDKAFGSAPNGAYPGQWVNAGSGKVGTVPTDPGIGISAVSYSSPQASGWGHGFQAVPGCKGVQCDECWNLSSRCESGHSTSNEQLTYSLSGLPEGEDTVEVKVENATGETATTTGKVLIDNAPPHNITLSGLGSGNQIGEYEHSHAKIEATDGSGSTPSSGVKSIAVAIDGREIGKPQGSCPKGPCTASGEWEINGAELGVGAHRLKATATDNAGNVATEEFTVTVHHATPVALGPGSVGPLSGEFSLSARDVSVSAPGSSLTVSRSYGSRHLTAGSEGPLGPQWSLSIGGQESITKLATGSVTLTAASGGQTTFTSKEGGGFNSPTGDASLALSETKNGKGELTEYVLKDAADAATTRFTSLSGPSASLWKPTKQEGPLASQTVRYIYQTVEGVTAPKWAIAPEPAGLSFSCVAKAEKSEKLEKGCRALYFKYAEKTKEGINENEKEWGEYKGRLKQVLFDAYNPAKGIEKMEEKPVAEYLYDKQGRLRAEWNPQIEPSLKTMYGYDAEGHVTALTPPGQESGAFTYGTIAGDASTGRLLKVTQAPISAALWNGKLSENTKEPTLSGTPVVGVRMAVSTGIWSNSPIVYGYQWEDCNSSGKECTPILGATNANYTVASSDVGHTLVAQVTATNGGGSVVAASAHSSEAQNQITEYPVGEAYFGVAVGADGNVWLTQEYWGPSGSISKVTPKGEVTTYKLSTPFCGPNYITPGPEKESALWFTDVCAAAIGKITTSGVTTDYKVPSGATLRQITAGPDGNLWFAEETAGKIGKITTSGVITEYELPKGSDPYGIAPGPSKESALWFTDRGTSKIGKITTSGVITEYELPKGSSPAGITAGPDGNLWFAEEDTSKVGKITTSGAITEYTVSGGAPYNITAGPDGNLWFTAGTDKIGKITTAGVISEYTLPAGSNPSGITAGPNGALWFAEMGTGKLGELSIESEGEAIAAQPGSTIEYHVPLSGTSLPTLTKEKVEEWGQTDDPTEGMAIFPPDEPQGWPASDYKHASITYLDEVGRAVNTTSPSGGISTSEYNGTNDVVRSLSADNRVAALKEGCKVVQTECKSAEVSKLLDTESTYEEKGSEPGTEVLSTLGPQHIVKLANGTQVEARSHTVYSYDEGAPSEGGPYDLVTKTTEGAQYSGKEEDVRTVTTSYSGQGNLGWKLRKPTSVTTDPGGLTLTHTITYEESTGSVKETATPGAAGEQTEFPVGEAYFGVAAGADGNLWLTQEYWGPSGSISKVTPKGEVTTYKLSTPFCGPNYITPGPEKESALWFTDVCAAAIGKITTSGVTTDYKVPSGATLRQITAGPDGNLWFAEETAGKIGKITTNGVITEYELPKGSDPYGIAPGPSKESALWFTDRGTSKIGKITTSGVITEYELPKGSSPAGITAGPDGNLWFAEEDTSKIGKITTSGTSYRILRDGRWAL